MLTPYWCCCRTEDTLFRNKRFPSRKFSCKMLQNLLCFMFKAKFTCLTYRSINFHDMGMLIHKILKHFAGTFCWLQTFYFWWVNTVFVPLSTELRMNLWLPFHKTLFHKTPFPKEPNKRNPPKETFPKGTHQKTPISKRHPRSDNIWHSSETYLMDEIETKIIPFLSLDNFLEHKSQIFK